MWLRTAAAAGVQIPFAIGMIKVSLQAFTAGAASIPGPLADPEQDWIVHRAGVAMGVAAADPAADAVAALQNFEIDSKAQRKCNAGDVLVWMAEGSGAAGDVLIGRGTNRFLFKLS